MNRTRFRLLLITLGVLGIAAVGTMPVAGYNSVTEALLRSLHRKLLWIAVPLAILVEALLFYAAIRFHNNDDPKSTEENRRLEIAWTIAVAVILLFVGASSYLVLANPMVSNTLASNSSNPGTVNVHVTGQNWFWEFSYPNDNVTTTNRLVLPANRTVVFMVTSKDVIHSVHIPSLGVKQDAIPGRTNTFRTKATDTGTYRLYCAEFCGTGHSKMLATVEIVSPDAYQRWLQQQKHAQNNTTNGSSQKDISSDSRSSPTAGESRSL